MLPLLHQRLVSTLHVVRRAPVVQRLPRTPSPPLPSRSPPTCSSTAPAAAGSCCPPLASSFPSARWVRCSSYTARDTCCCCVPECTSPPYPSHARRTAPRTAAASRPPRDSSCPSGSPAAAPSGTAACTACCRGSAPLFLTISSLAYACSPPPSCSRPPSPLLVVAARPPPRSTSDSHAASSSPNYLSPRECPYTTLRTICPFTTPSNTSFFLWSP